MFRHIDRVKGKQGAVILLMALAIFASSRLPAAAQSTTVTGVIQNASGESLAGALVKVRSAELGLTFMVVSQAQGRYSTPDLPPGKYTVQGFGGDQQSDPAGPVEVASGQQAELDVVLSTPRKISPPRKRMTSADYAELMPAGDAKRLLMTRCVICHGLERIVPRRVTRESWQKSVGKMRFYLQERRVPLSDQEENTIVDYVSKHFGPDTPPLPRPPIDPNQHLPRTLLQGAEARYVAMELDLRDIAGNHDIAVDSQGIVWVSEEKKGDGMLGRFDPQSFAYTRIAPPPAKFPRRGLYAIAVDSQDHVWFTANDGPTAQWFQYDPRSEQFTTYDIPVPPRVGPDINTLGFLDGKLWGTGLTSGRIVMLDPDSRKVAEFPVPQGSRPYGLVIGADQMIWYVGDYGRAVIRLDPGTGRLTLFKTPTPNADLRRMGIDGDGNLWAGALETGKLVKVDYRSGEVTEYTPPTQDPGPQSVKVDTKRNLIWFNERYADKMARFDPSDNSFVEFPLPSVNTDGRRIRLDPTNPNRVWWDGRSGWIGYIEVLE